MVWLLTIGLGGLILAFLHYLTSENLNYFKKRGFPQMEMGVLDMAYNLFLMLFQMVSVDKLMADVYVKTEEHKYCGFSLLGRQLIMIRDPDLINQVTIKDFSHFVDRPVTGTNPDGEGDLMTAGILGVSGDSWRWQRYKLAPTFTSGKLKSMYSNVLECSDDVISYIDKKKGQINVTDLTNSYSLNVIGSVAFGIKVNAQETLEGVKNKFVEMSLRLFQPRYKQILSFTIASLFPTLSKKLGINLVDEETDQFFEGLIQHTIQHRKKTGNTRNDFLQIMINIKDKDENTANEEKDENYKELLENVQTIKNINGYKFTNRIIAANSFIFIGGGSESTAGSTASVLFELAANPAIQEKLRDDIDKAMPNRDFDYNTLNSLPFLDNVVNETLRKYPSFADFQRTCIEDYTIPGTDHVIKKGDELVIPIGPIQLDPKYFPDPEKFDPDRFLDMDSIVKGTYIPFGSGPRFCIGMRLALVEIKVFVAKVLLLYKVKLSSKTKYPLEYENSVFRQVKGGIWLEFLPRT